MASHPGIELLYGSQFFREQRALRAKNIVDCIEPHLNPTDGEAFALDFGSGNGEILQALGCRITDRAWMGVDVYNGLKERNQNFFLYDGGNLPVQEGCVDTVVIGSVLHHIPQDAYQRILQELFRVLKPTGRIILVEDYIGGKGKVFPLNQYIRTADAAMNLGVPGGQLMNHKTIQEWVDLFHQNRFELAKGPTVTPARAAIILPWVLCTMSFKKSGVEQI